MIRHVMIACAAATALSGCAINASSIQAAAPLVDSLARAGCSGTLHLEGSLTTGVMGPPSGHIGNTFDGKCDPSTAPKAP